MRVVDARRLERGRERAVKSARASDRHLYFYGVAQARYVLRKVFRLVEEEAKRAGIDPLAHQALIQIYGSETSALKVKEVAARLDITPAFASSLVKSLAAKGLISTMRDKQDSRVSWVKVTKDGRALLHRIDEQVQIHVDYFTRGLSAQQTEAALSILMFYAGISFKPPPRHAAEKAS
ncbi:MAG TPA: MarR family winged helix-turn-helix transcriptional regulator [Micropepsaceae bacterium]|nr:MarR family winged helix-turn-helix transcriptional regulator [Micropepsaceae bacterium]